MIYDPRLSFHVMRAELKIGEFLQVVSIDSIVGIGAEVLRKNLAGSSENTVIGLNKKDIKAYTDAIFASTGRRLREMTEKEWDSIPQDIKNQISGGHFFWTATKSSQDAFVLCQPGASHRGRRLNVFQDVRCEDYAVLLVEDKEPIPGKRFRKVNPWRTRHPLASLIEDKKKTPLYFEAFVTINLWLSKHPPADTTEDKQ